MGFGKYETSVRPTIITIPNPFFEVMPRIRSLPSPENLVAMGSKPWKGGAIRLPLGHQDECLNCSRRARIKLTFESKKKVRICFDCKDKILKLLRTIEDEENYEEEEEEY